jgi:hypothetical protein
MFVADTDLIDGEEDKVIEEAYTSSITYNRRNDRFLRGCVWRTGDTGKQHLGFSITLRKPCLFVWDGCAEFNGVLHEQLRSKLGAPVTRRHQ